MQIVDVCRIGVLKSGQRNAMTTRESGRLRAKMGGTCRRKERGEWRKAESRCGGLLEGKNDELAGSGVRAGRSGERNERGQQPNEGTGDRRGQEGPGLEKVRADPELSSSLRLFVSSSSSPSSSLFVLLWVLLETMVF